MRKFVLEGPKEDTQYAFEAVHKVGARIGRVEGANDVYQLEAVFPADTSVTRESIADLLAKKSPAVTVREPLEAAA